MAVINCTRFGLFGICLLAFGCGEEEDETLSLFNASDDTFEINVGTEEVGTEKTIDLHSSTGQVIVGTATINPDAGPIGTEHELVIIVDDTWEAQVEKVRLTVDSGDRGIESFTMIRDSADPGYHTVSILSVGEEGETRTDIFTIELLANDNPTPSTTDTGASNQ